MNQVTYTNSQEPENELEEIRVKLVNMEKGDPTLELLSMVPDLAKEKTPEQLQRMREKALAEASRESPMVAVLVELFMNATISYSMDFAEKKSSRQDPREESEPAAKSDKSLPKQDNSITQC